MVLFYPNMMLICLHNPIHVVMNPGIYMYQGPFVGVILYHNVQHTISYGQLHFKHCAAYYEIAG